MIITSKPLYTCAVLFINFYAMDFFYIYIYIYTKNAIMQRSLRRKQHIPKKKGDQYAA